MNVDDVSRPVSGPPALPQRQPIHAPEDPYARSRAWAFWTYETVTEAIRLFGARGTFTELLNFFAEKRRSLAVAYRSHEAELFGVWRDENLAAAQRTRTTFFGPACPPYDKVVNAYQSILGVDISLPFEGVVRGRIRSDVYELTSYKCDAYADDPRARMWLHTHWRHVPILLNHCRELFEQALEPISDDAAWSTLAELHWWFVHAMPFARGSTSIGSWIVCFVLRMRGAGNVRFYEDPAAVALVSPSPRAYEAFFRANVELMAGVGVTSMELLERRLAFYARTGQVWRLRRLLKRVPANVREPTGFTPLHLAARAGKAGAVKALLQAGAPVHALLDDSMETPLHLAARSGHGAVVRRLVAAGAALQAEDAFGTTPLHWAAREGHFGLVWWLLRAGAQWDVADSLGRLPLHYAAERGFQAGVRWLTARKAGRAGINRADVRGETPLSVAALRGQTATVRLLLQRGGLPPAQDPHLFAIKMGNKEMALREEPIDISLYGLMRRVRERGHVETYNFLLKELVKPLARASRERVSALLQLKPGEVSAFILPGGAEG